SRNAAFEARMGGFFSFGFGYVLRIALKTELLEITHHLGILHQAFIAKRIDAIGNLHIVGFRQGRRRRLGGAGMETNKRKKEKPKDDNKLFHKRIISGLAASRRRAR